MQAFPVPFARAIAQGAFGAAVEDRLAGLESLERLCEEGERIGLFRHLGRILLARALVFLCAQEAWRLDRIVPGGYVVGLDFRAQRGEARGAVLRRGMRR